MGCKSSTLKNETETEFIQPVNVRSPVKTSIVEAAEAKVIEPTVIEEKPVPEVESKPEPVFETPVVEQAPEPVVEEQAPAPVVEVTPEPIVTPVVVPTITAVPQVYNNENAAPSKKQIFAAAAAPKRVAFAARLANTFAHGTASTEAKKKTKLRAPKPSKAAKVGKQANMDQDVYKQMMMAFQRELTHADHLERNLATR